MDREENRNRKRDAKQNKYKPVKTGKPLGFSKSEWYNKKKKGDK